MQGKNGCLRIQQSSGCKVFTVRKKRAGWPWGTGVDGGVGQGAELERHGKNEGHNVNETGEDM